MVSHRNVANNYFNSCERNHFNKDSNVYFENDTLYSYGTHFILAQRVKNGYILNGDTYSSSTAKHQAYTRQEAQNHNFCIIPISAIYGFCVAQKIPTYGLKNIIKEFEILDKLEDFYTEQKYKDKEGMEQTREIHHLGASLVKYRNYYLLSGLDVTGKRHQYFLILLKHQCNSVEEAFRDLAGNLSDFEYEQYLQGIVKRQGEYFLIPTDKTTKELKQNSKLGIQKGFDLSLGVGNKHFCTEYIKTKEKKGYIRKTLRHRQHKMIKMNKVWHEVRQNTQKGSWSAGGRVD